MTNLPDPNLQRDLNKNGAEFLSLDIDTALTFAQIAADPARGTETRQRNRCNARKAYDTVRQLSRKVDFTSDEKARFEIRLAALKQALLQLGENL